MPMENPAEVSVRGSLFMLRDKLLLAPHHEPQAREPRPARTAAYPGRLWRPGRTEPANCAEPEAAGEDRAASPWA
jgi:hypothetical protein